MATTISRHIIESFLNCKYKAYLELAGEHGIRSDYALLLDESRDEARRRAIDKILALHHGDRVEQDVVLSQATLKRGAAFILNATLENAHSVLVIDGLKRVPRPSKLGNFHYVPVPFSADRQVRKHHRSMLEVYGLILGQLQGRAPENGIVWHGNKCCATRTRLNADPRKAERLLNELRQMQNAEAPPRLVLNDHCHVCEFRQRCHQQALQEDNISLLRGMKEKEVKAYARKGILTVTQLAHTFRPRRKGKRAPPRPDRHSHALQALSVRDKKVYVFGTPQLPASRVRVFLDIEGNPEEGSEYLVGLIVVVGEQEQRYSFWADTKDQESDIFEQFLGIVGRYDDYLVFAYGGYERAFLKRMRKQAKTKGTVDRVLKSLRRPTSRQARGRPLPDEKDLAWFIRLPVHHLADEMGMPFRREPCARRSETPRARRLTHSTCRMASTHYRVQSWHRSQSRWSCAAKLNWPSASPVWQDISQNS
jgi:predicted RecB family nuclease